MLEVMIRGANAKYLGIWMRGKNVLSLNLGFVKGYFLEVVDGKIQEIHEGVS